MVVDRPRGRSQGRRTVRVQRLIRYLSTTCMVQEMVAHLLRKCCSTLTWTIFIVPYYLLLKLYFCVYAEEQKRMAEDMAAIHKYLGEEVKRRGKRRIEDKNEEDRRRKKRRTCQNMDEEDEDGGTGRWAERMLNEGVLD